MSAKYQETNGGGDDEAEGGGDVDVRRAAACVFLVDDGRAVLTCKQKG